MESAGTKRDSGFINSVLNDDLLAQIVNKVCQKRDRKSFSEVCKQWLRVERVSRTSLKFSRPMISQLALLTKFPNLVDLRTGKLTELRKRQYKQSRYYPPTDTRLEIIAQACPKLETFMVRFVGTTHVKCDGQIVELLIVGIPIVFPLFRTQKLHFSFAKGCRLADVV